MKRVGDKQSARNRLYAKLRKQYLEENRYCEVCGGMATDVHHKKGRLGWRLIAIGHFLPVCRTCHDKIEQKPKWAKENGYSENRK